MTTLPDITKPFVNREREITLAEKRFDDLLRQKMTDYPVLFFYGVPGIGKTTLLKEMLRRAGKHGIPTAIVDFATDTTTNNHNGHKAKGTYEGDEGKVNLALELLEQLERTADAPAFARIHPDEDQPEDAAAKTVQQIRRLHRGAYNKPVALFFDTLEDVNRETFSWLQERILKPALDEGEVFIALAARAHYKALRLKIIYPMLRQMEIHELLPFDAEDTRTQFQRWGVVTTKDFTLFTGGIPGLNEEVVLKEYYRETDALPGRVVDMIFEHIAKKVEEIQDELLVAAALRWFSDRLLARIAHHFWPEKYEENRRIGNRLARRLLESMLVEERLGDYGYAVVPELRKVLDDYQRSEHPQQHMETHLVAYRWFGEEVKAGDWRSLVDQVYHLAAAWYDLDHIDMLSPPGDFPYPSPKERLAFLQDFLRHGLESLPAEADENMFESMSQDFEESEEFRWFLKAAEVRELAEFCSRYPNQTPNFPAQQ